MGWIKDLFSRPRRKTWDPEQSNSTDSDMHFQAYENDESDVRNDDQGNVMEDEFGIRDSAELYRERLGIVTKPSINVKREEATSSDQNDGISASAMTSSHEEGKEERKMSRVGKRTKNVSEKVETSFLTPMQTDLANSLSKSLFQARTEVSDLTAALDRITAI